VFWREVKLVDHKPVKKTIPFRDPK